MVEFSRTIAFFGGSFNPPHVAHQLACLVVLETQPVDEVLVVPCFRHPFDKPLASFADRLEMCRLAVAPLGSRAGVSDIEAELGGKASLTLATLEALGRRHPDAVFRLVIGADILPERGKWWRWNDVERLAPPIVLGRQGCPTPPEIGDVLELPAVSSTDIRARVAAGASIDHMVPRSVAAYIRDRGLYL